MQVKARQREKTYWELNESAAVLCNGSTGCGVPRSGYPMLEIRLKIRKEGCRPNVRLSLVRVNNISFILMPRKSTEF